MLTHRIAPNRDLLIYDHHEALIAAGSSELESEFHQDQALESFFHDRSVHHWVWDPDTYQQTLELAVTHGVQVLIIKKETK
jgi:hypothetical protein